MKHFFSGDGSAGTYLGSHPNESIDPALVPGVNPLDVIEVVAAAIPAGTEFSTVSVNTGTGAITYDPTSRARLAGLEAARLEAISAIFAHGAALIELVVEVSDGNPALSPAQQAKVDAIKADFLPMLTLVAPSDFAVLEARLVALIGKVSALPVPAPVTIPGTIV